MFRAPDINATSLIRTYSQNYDEQEVRAAEVLDLLKPAERAHLLRRVGADAEKLRGELRGLLPSQKAQLLQELLKEPSRAETLLQEPDAARAVHADSVAAVFDRRIDSVAVQARAAAGVTQADLARAFDAAIKPLRDSALALVISSHPDIERQVLGSLLGTRTVGSLVQAAPGRESSRLSLRTQQQLAGADPINTSQMRDVGSSMAWGVSEFVVDRVEQQLRTYALRGLTRKLCADLGADMLRESCLVLNSSQFGVSSGGASLLRSAVRRDLERLPTTALAWTYSKYGSDIWAGGGDEMQVVQRAIGFTLQVSRGTDPWLALAASVDSIVPARRALLEAQIDSRKKEIEAIQQRFDAAGARDELRALTRRRERLEAEISTLSRSLVERHLDPAQFPLASVFASLASLYGTRFDPLRISSAIWEDGDADALLRAQLIAMLANTKADVQRAPVQNAFQPWRFAGVAVSVEAELAAIHRMRTQADSLRRKVGGDSMAVRHARFALARSGFAALDRILVEVQMARLADVTGAQRAIGLAQQIVFPLVDGDYSSAVLGLRDQVAYFLPDSLNPGQNPEWMRGLTFVSELSGTASADQVSAALVRLTEGGQGFVAKRSAEQWQFALNAFGGVYGGPNWSGFTRERAGSESASFGGLYLPVGLALTSPGHLRVRSASLGTVSLFLQAADLGALASWRLEQDTTLDERPEIGLAQVFSPGMFLVLNIPGIPVSVGYGWSYAPQLRRARDLDEGAEEKALFSADRRGLFLAMDIPLFP